MHIPATRLLAASLIGLGLALPAAAQSLCGLNLVVDGDFEVLNPSTPSQPVPSSYIGNVKSPIGGGDDLMYWKAANYSTPDYYTTHAQGTWNGSSYTYPPTNPYNASFGAFQPYGYMLYAPVFYGCLGLQTYYTNYTGTRSGSEFALGKLSKQLDNGREYYATMQVYRASGSNITTTIGMELLGASFQPNNSYTYDNGFSAPYVYSPSGKAGLQSGYAIGSSQWTRISQMITAQGGEQQVLLGCFTRPTSSQANVTGYQYIDAVGIYEIPTAGNPVTTCPNQSVTLGSSCMIPGVLYEWIQPFAGVISSSKDTGTGQVTVSPGTSTTYTLRMTFPDNSVRTSQVTVTVQAATAPSLYEASNNQCTKTIQYRIGGFNPAYTYTVTTTGDIMLQGSNPVAAGFTIVGTSSSPNSSGSLTLTLSGCGPDVSTSANAYFGAAEPSGTYYTNNSSTVRLQTYQTVPSPGSYGTTVNLTLSESYDFSFTSSSPYVNITTVSPRAIRFTLQRGQGTTIRATATNAPCAMSGQFVFMTPTNPDGSPAVRATPNPASTDLTVTRETSDSESLREATTASRQPAELEQVELYDSFGHRVRAQRAGQDRTVLDVRNLPAGLYTLRTGQGKNVVTQRIQVVH